MALDQECPLPVGKKYSQEEDKKEEKNFLHNTFSSLKKRSEFLLVRRRGRTTHGEFFIVNYSFSDKTEIKIGLTVSKKIGNAVRRNYFKRIFRYIIRKNLSYIPKNINLEIIPKRKLETKKFVELEKDFLRIMKNLVI